MDLDMASCDGPTPRRKYRRYVFAAGLVAAFVAAGFTPGNGPAEVAVRNARLVMDYLTALSRGERIGPPAFEVAEGSPVRADGAFVPSGVIGVVAVRASRSLCESLAPELARDRDAMLNGKALKPSAPPACVTDDAASSPEDTLRNLIHVRIR